jgi:trehalose-6-phosphate synthase
VIISFKLPILIERGKRGELIVNHSKSILFNTLFNLQQRNKKVRTVWIGWPGITPNTDKEQEEIE